MADKFLLALLGILIAEEEQADEEAQKREVRRHPPAEPFYSIVSGMPPAAEEQEEDFMQITATLTDAQIRGLPNSVIEIIPAQGVGKLIVPIVYVFSFAGTTAYGTVGATSTFGITGLNSGYDYTPTTKLKCTGFLSSTPPQQYLTVLIGGNENAIVVGPNDETNQGLAIYASNGGDDFTDGNPANTLKITVIYQVVTL